MCLQSFIRGMTSTIPNVLIFIGWVDIMAVLLVLVKLFRFSLLVEGFNYTAIRKVVAFAAFIAHASSICHLNLSKAAEQSLYRLFY